MTIRQKAEGTFLSLKMEAKKQWNYIFRILVENEPRIVLDVKLPSKNRWK